MNLVEKGRVSGLKKLLGLRSQVSIEFVRLGGQVTIGYLIIEEREQKSNTMITKNMKTPEI